jgi:DNA-binding IclR family transcriptional regulator
MRRYKSSLAVARAILASDGEVYNSGLCRQLNMPSGVVSPILRRMEDIGWLAARPEDVLEQGCRSGARRCYYRLADREALTNYVTYE